VVNVADVPTTHKEKVNKTDQRDSRKLGSSLRAGELQVLPEWTNKEYNIYGSIATPETTTDDGWNNTGQALMFYKLCLMEQYMHSIIHNLTK